MVWEMFSSLTLGPLKPVNEYVNAYLGIAAEYVS